MRVQLFWAFLWKGTGIVAAFLASVLVARTLGPQQAGWVALGQSTAVVISTVALLGMDTAAMRELSIFRARGAQLEASRVVATALLGGAGATVTVVALSALVVVIGHLRGLFFSADAPVILIGIVVSVGLAGSRLMGELLRASGAIGAAVWFQGASGPLITVAGILLCRQFLSDYVALWMIVVGECSAGAWALLWWRRVWRHPMLRPDLRLLKTLLRTGLTIFLIGLGAVLIGWIEILALSHWRGSREIALQNSAQRVASLVSLPLLVINMAAAPRYAACYATGDMARLRTLVIKVIGLGCLMGLPVVGCLLGFGSSILQIFGPQFVAANDNLRIVLIGQFVNMLTGPAIYLLMMSGKERAGLACVGLAVLTDLICISILVPRFGLIGAGISNATAVCVMNIGAAIMAYSDLLRRPAAVPGGSTRA
jgi:O-antigen/teichoic acid export membrane protein